MITTRAFMDQVWIDLNSPTKEEVDSLVLTQNVSPVVAKDLLAPTPTQYAEEDGPVIYTVLHIPVFRHSHTVEDSQEVDFIISTNGVVTVRYESVDALHYFAKQMEVNEILNKGKNSHLFFGIMREIYKSMINELAYMEDWMTEIEKNIFGGQERAMVMTISNAGRNLLNFKRIVEPHGNIFEFLKETGKGKYGEKFEAEARTLAEEWRRIIKRVNNQIDLVTELRETNNSMLSTKQNEIMKNLAIIGSILLPVTIVGQLFGLSVRSFPLLNHPYAFWIILGIMATVMLLSVIYARLKKWM
ncbi:MAG: magnesium transporter CorA family protein [Candidatus Zambryskibacteria bacterium]